MVTELARSYSELFSPEYFVLFCAITVLLYERRRERRISASNLAGRFGVLGVAWIVAFALYKSTPLVFRTVPSWGPDFTGSVGLGVGIGFIWLAWRRFEWGSIMPEFAAVLVSLTLAHLAITPFWDVSSHVAYTAAPAGHLATVSRRFVPLLVVPIGMVAARPLAGAHTWGQSIGGLVLAAAFLAGLLRYRTGREGRATVGSTRGNERL